MVTQAFYRIDKNTFGSKVRFTISGIWEGGNGSDVLPITIIGVNEMQTLDFDTD
jgi:hypothetical protein